MRRLTAVDALTIAAIEAHVKETGRPPTYREILRATGRRSMNKLRARLVKLQEMGYLDRLPGLARGTTVTKQTS